MFDHQAAINPVCRRECPTRWCCATGFLVSVPLSETEIHRIADRVGRNDFHRMTSSGSVLRTRPNGYCVFFDPVVRSCTIYPDRPFDCRLYPFDFYTAFGRLQWLLWDCPYSRHITPSGIETELTRLETDCLAELERIWDYENESIDLDHPDGFRVLRRMRVRRPITSL